jgi:outer membrane protein assembly factor BamB
MRNPALVAVFGVLVGSFVLADDWPQFRGSDRSGISKEKGLLPAWPKDGPKLAWTFKQAGMGHSGVAVAKGVVYTLGTDMKNAKDDFIIAIDEKTGEQLWTVKLGPTMFFKGNIWGNGPRSIPAIDGNLLFALSSTGDLVCVDIAEKGKEVWRKNLVKDFNGELMTEYGFSESPLVDGDHLIVTPGGKDGTLAALDKKTGKVVWRSTEWTDLAPYSSVVAAEINGVKQYVQTGYVDEKIGGFIAGVDAKTGKLLWRESIFKHYLYALASTQIVTGNQVYVSYGGNGGGCHLFAIGKNNSVTEKFSKANLKKFANPYGGVVLIDGHIYGHNEKRGWACQSLGAGKEVWLERNDLSCSSGAITAADGNLYLFTDAGEVGLVKADPTEFKLISSFKLPQQAAFRLKVGTVGSSSKPWAHPVIANGHLYLRDHELIFRYKITK